MSASLGDASGQLIGLSDDLQTPGNHAVLFSFSHGALSGQDESQNVTVVLGLHKSL
jgi:hypothetical protein